MKIVLIDNDSAFIRSLELLLESQGHDVLAFENPVIALDILRNENDFEILITDYQMPEMNGCEFFFRLDECLTRHYVKVLISAHTDILDKEEIHHAGVHYFLPKPVDLNRLTSIIQEHGNDFHKPAV